MGMQGQGRNAPDDGVVSIVGSEPRPKLVGDPKRNRNCEADHIWPRDKLVSFSNGKQFMTVSELA